MEADDERYVSPHYFSWDSMGQLYHLDSIDAAEPTPLRLAAAGSWSESKDRKAHLISPSLTGHDPPSFS